MSYGLDGPVIELPEGARFYAHGQTGPLGLTEPQYYGYRVFLVGKAHADPSPLLVPWLRKSRTITLLLLWAVRPVQSLSACTVQLYLYSTYALYGLYRVSVPVQYSYTSTPPMGRTACTEPHCL